MATWLLVALALTPASWAGTDIRSVDGAAEIFLPSLREWRPVARLPFGLRPGDRVRLKPRSSARLSLANGSTLRLARDAELVLESDNERGAVVRLAAGVLDASIERYHDRIVEIHAPTALVSLRNDRVRLSIERNNVVSLEVLDGLAHVQPRVGPRVEVPEDYRLDIAADKAPGLPLSRKEYAALQALGRPAAPGQNRKLPRRRAPASPVLGPDPVAERKAPAPPLGAGSLGLQAREEASPEEPALGPSSLGLEPDLGPQALGLREAAPVKPAEPALGLRSLGLRDPVEPAPRRMSK